MKLIAKGIKKLFYSKREIKDIFIHFLFKYRVCEARLILLLIRGDFEIILFDFLFFSRQMSTERCWNGKGKSNQREEPIFRTTEKVSWLCFSILFLAKLWLSVNYIDFLLWKIFLEELYVNWKNWMLAGVVFPC